MIGTLVLAIIGLVLVLIGYGIKNDDNGESLNMFMCGLILLMISMLAIGVLMGKNEIKNSKHKVTPVVKVECMNTKCDTTYIYSFKEEK